MSNILLTNDDGYDEPVLCVRDTKSGDTIWTRHSTHDEPVDGKNVSRVVAALDGNVQRCVTELSAGLDELFRSQPAKS
jgi:hypothetical protein